MIIFAILGLHLFAGSLESRCRETQMPEGGEWIPTIDRLCGDGYSCPDEYTCGSSYSYLSILGEEYVKKDVYLPEFNYGYTTFDNVLRSLFTVFIVNEGNWKNMLEMLSDGYDNIIGLIYLTITYFICNFFILQIAVAVMSENFSRLKDGISKKAIFSSLMGEKEKSKLEKMMT